MIHQAVVEQNAPINTHTSSPLVYGICFQNESYFSHQVKAASKNANWADQYKIDPKKGGQKPL